MDINSLEEIIQFSMVENEKKLQATQYLDQVRVSPDRWNVGLSLFFDAKSEVARFFGLSLVRDYMSTLDPTISTESMRHCVRDAMKTWLHRVLSQNLPVPNYIVNNVASIVTLCIKNDYPELWPTAFSDLLQIGHTYSFNGIDVVVRVLNDLEVEVIMFNEGRTKSEIAHNVLIKDTMRATNVIKDCVVFLCTSAKTAVAANMKDIAERTLLCLAELIGWIDIHMTINEALSTIYALFQDKRTRSAAAVCLFEVAKKGMDPILKVQLIHSIGLLPVLVGFPISESGAVEELKQVGLVVDMVVVELIGCWTKFEDSVVFSGKGRSGSMDKTSSGGGGGGGGGRKSANASVSGTPRSEMSTESSPEALLEILPTVFQLLRASMGVLFSIFNHGDVAVAGSVFPSCNRLISLLKQQCANKTRIEGMFAPGGAVPNINGASVLNYINQESYFLAMDYLNPLLSGIYRQMQYPADFDFLGYEDSLNSSSAVINGTVDDEDNDIVEAKKEVRKLFVNCCRVHPERCLELVGAVLAALPQPISKCAFPPLEAALRLVHAFSECGPSNAKYVNEGTFPSLIAAIHSTDIAQHTHPQVLLSYFEISLRYVKLVDINTLLGVIQSLVSVLRRPSTSAEGAMIRNKCAYFIAKIAEAMEGKSSQLLASVGTHIADVIVGNARNPLEALTASPGPASTKSAGRLTDAAELSLFETIGLMTSSTFYQQPGEEQVIRQYQQTLLGNTTHFLIEHIKEVVNNRAQLSRYVELFTVFIAHKINCLSCLAKGHNFKTHAQNIPTFDSATGVIVSVLELMPQIALIRAKCVVFLHRMVSSLGPRCTLYVTQAMGVLLRHAELADMEETCLLFNQCVVEFQLNALPMVTRYHAEVVEKFKQLNIQFENAVNSNGAMEAPHIEGERVALQKQYLLYLQHVANNNCYPALTAPENVSRLEDLLETLLVCLKGGRGGRLGAPISQNAGLPLRKGAAVVLVALMKVFCHPSNTITAEAASAAGFPSVNAANLSPQLIASFQSYLLDHVVPTVISSCSDGGRSINVKDAAAQTFLVEVASILWILHHILGTQMTVSYLTDLFTKLGWNASIQQACIQQLVTPSPLGTYKEAFKQFIRSCS